MENEFTLEETLQPPLPGMKSAGRMQGSWHDAGEGASRGLHFSGSVGGVRHH